LSDAQAGVVYSNDFEHPATAFNGFSAGGTLSSTLTTAQLPSDSAGIHSPTQSTWLGRLGENIGKSASVGESVTLQLNGLSIGATYTVAFDLFIGASWDGSASAPWGVDSWSLHAQSGANSTPLVDATFSNCGLNICGAYSPQTYSIATPLGGLNGQQFGVQTGAAAAYDNGGPGHYSEDYAIYYFSHGGGPTLSFVAAAGTATLVFARGLSGSGDSADEFWALDNVRVTSPVPLPATALLLAPVVLALGAARRRG
jgi:hypothetical protein